MAKSSVNTILLVLAAVLLVPFASYAAGLGTLTVRSALGQPLDAEIEVVALRPGEDLQIRLASRDAYSAAGVDFSPALQGARFAIERRDGRTVIRVRTNEPVNDPFLSVLVEVQLPSGRLARQYTVLVDPAEFRRAAAPAPAVPSVAAAQAPAVAQSIAAPAPARAPTQAVAATPSPAPAPATPVVAVAPPPAPSAPPVALAPAATPTAPPVAVAPPPSAPVQPPAPPVAAAPEVVATPAVVAAPAPASQPVAAAPAPASQPVAAAPAPTPAQPTILTAAPVEAPAQSTIAAVTPPATQTVAPPPLVPAAPQAPAPASVTSAPTAPVVSTPSPAAVAAAAPSVQPAPVSAPRQAEQFAAPSVAVAAAPLAQPAAPAAAAAPTQQSADASDTYRIKRGDTLGAIARKWKPEGVTHGQMLMGLYQTNRPVFIRDNINLIRAGATLFIPGREDVSAISAADAARQVRTHMVAFGKYRDTAVSTGAGSERISQAQREVINRRVGVKRSTRAM